MIPATSISPKSVFDASLAGVSYTEEGSGADEKEEGGLKAASSGS